MNPTTVGGMISIESHTKQIKLLNDYILSLEKKVSERKDDQSSKQNLAEEMRRLNQDNNKLRNQNAQLRYNSYKNEENSRKLPTQELENAALRTQLEKERKDKNQLLAQNQNISTHLINCEAHLHAAETQIQKRTETFERDSKVLASEAQELKNKLSKLGLQHNVLREEKKTFQLKVKETEGTLAEAIKSKNQAIIKLSQAQEELKSKLNDEIAVSNSKKQSYNGQVRELVNQLNQSRTETVSARKEAFELKIALQKRTEEVQNVISKLGLKTQEYENSVRLNNDEKTNLIRIIRKLQQEKKILQALNSTVKGESSEQGKLRNELLKKNETLASELTEASKQVAQLRTQLHNISFLKQQVEQKVQSLNNEFTNMKLMRDETELKRKEMEQTNQNLLKDFFNSKNYFEYTLKNLQQAIDKKNKYIPQLQQKINQLQAQLHLFKNNSDSSSKEFFSFKHAKESEISSLNLKIHESIKQQTLLKQSLEAVKQEYQFYQKRKEGEIQDMSNRIKDLQKQLLTLKDSNDLLTREYYTFQKKSEADNFSLNQRIRDQIKKLEKKDVKIGELQAEIKQIQKINENSRKNIGESQRQELDRIKNKFQKEKAELSQLITEQRLRSEQLNSQKLLALKQIQQLQTQIRSLKEELRGKEKGFSQTAKHLERERNELLQQVKTLSLSMTLTSHSKSSQEIQIQTMKRNIIHLQGYSNQQKKSIESLNKLLAQKQSEVQSLENSNAMLRKQVIASINNEEVSRKEVLEVRSRTNSGVATSRLRGSTSRKTNYSQLPPKQVYRFAESMVNAVDTRKNLILIQSEINNNSGLNLIDEMSLLSSTGVRPDDTFSLQTKEL